MDKKDKDRQIEALRKALELATKLLVAAEEALGEEIPLGGSTASTLLSIHMNEERKASRERKLSIGSNDESDLVDMGRSL